ncbi:hypothetical protein RHGRI_021473 [Rhododendron griersonianum]|uniref:beta-galactosidase n=1 Tax=Rhododendron griersonianum TaxID=479676 RepID=A0AAV6JNM5_9ERIC|nr:hypothetical protein RHGRI_021473 [Rhododendron griersonianum]
MVLQYDFEGRKDLVKFVKLVAEAGLYVHLRIGPYVCAEWNYGNEAIYSQDCGHDEARSSMHPKADPLSYLRLIENEYGNMDSAYGSAATTYINWAASMATSLDTGVPWVMCQQKDAPDPMINTSNGFYCDQFTPNSTQKPKMWTENWSGWFLSFGGAVPYRPVEDLAFAVACFFPARWNLAELLHGICYHSGTNFGRTNGGPFIATSYDYDAPIDEYGEGMYMQVGFGFYSPRTSGHIVLQVVSIQFLVAIVQTNPLSPPYPFNVMFQTSIGPSGLSPGYMRRIFVNFKDLYYCNGNKLPFAAAQIGQALRNEISPHQGLLRVREFTLAEIEHFVDPEDKSHQFSEVSILEFLMFPREDQGIVNNETLGYFIGRVYLFLTHLGIDRERLWFHQHLANEMAHYATDCWDAEIECSYGWIECVGIADRSAYDLRAHTDKSGVPLVAAEKFSEPIEVEKLVITPVKKELGLAFKGKQKMVVEALEAMGEKEAMEMKATLESKGEVEFQVCTLGKDVTITKSMVSILKEKKKEHQRVFTPSRSGYLKGYGIRTSTYATQSQAVPNSEVVALKEVVADQAKLIADYAKKFETMMLFMATKNGVDPATIPGLISSNENREDTSIGQEDGIST